MCDGELPQSHAIIPLILKVKRVITVKIFKILFFIIILLSKLYHFKIVKSRVKRVVFIDFKKKLY